MMLFGFLGWTLAIVTYTSGFLITLRLLSLQTNNKFKTGEYLTEYKQQSVRNDAIVGFGIALVWPLFAGGMTCIFAMEKTANFASDMMTKFYKFLGR